MISLTAPPVYVSGSVTFEASITDASGAAVSAAFAIDGAKVPSIASPPSYRATWNSTQAADGAHTLTVTATDSGGRSAQDSASFAVDNTPPRVSIAAPATGASVSGTVTVAATASDGSGAGVTDVQLLVDGKPLGSPVTSAPYEASWNTLSVSNGAHTLSAKATDGVGHTATSPGVDVTVANVTPPAPVTVAAVGDIACDPGDPASGIPPAPSFGNVTNWNSDPTTHTQESCQQMGVAQVVESIHPQAFLGLGDFAYEQGLPSSFTYSYGWDPPPGPVGSDRGFSQFYDITYPTVGSNHDAFGGSGFGAYFASRMPSGRTYYSFTLGSWHVIVLDSSCATVNGSTCSTGGAQETWLRNDLASDTSLCTLAYFHVPMWDAGQFEDDFLQRPIPGQNVLPLWEDLQAANVDLVLSGHDHDYQRYAPLRLDMTDPTHPTAVVDPANGIPEIIVGTGGKNHLPGTFTIDTSHTGLLVSNGNTFGALELTLGDGGYSGRFVPEAGRSFTDSFSGSCH